jgi:hypothetical protein
MKNIMDLNCLMRGAGLTRGARTLYDIRDGSLFPDMNSGSVQSGLRFDVDLEAFRSGWDRASNGGSKEGIMMELNTSVLAGHADRWIRKLYKLDQVSHHFCLPVISPAFARLRARLMLKSFTDSATRLFLASLFDAAP